MRRYLRAARRRLPLLARRLIQGAGLTIKHTGLANRREASAQYPSRWHFEAAVTALRRPDRFDALLAMNYVTEEFLEFDGPKLFYTKEPPAYWDTFLKWHWDEREFQTYLFRYDDPDETRRMYFPAIRISEDGLNELEDTLNRPRGRRCCIINRYADNPAANLLRHRIEFVEAFSDSIDIFGHNPMGDGRGWSRFRNYRGPVESKHATLRRYDFVLAFENSDYPGYISEKIFDALSAGCIPLYWGGAGLERELIPANCYVDCRERNPKDVLYLVKNCTDADIVRYRRAGLTFLRSEGSRRFTWGDFARRVLGRLQEQRVDAQAIDRGTGRRE